MGMIFTVVCFFIGVTVVCLFTVQGLLALVLRLRGKPWREIFTRGETLIKATLRAAEAAVESHCTEAGSCKAPNDFYLVKRVTIDALQRGLGSLDIEKLRPKR